MRRIIILLILLICTPAYGWMSAPMLCGGVAAAACTYPVKDSYATGADMARDLGYAYNSSSFTTTSAYSLVRTTVALKYEGTNPSETWPTITAYIFSDNGSGVPDTLLGTSTNTISTADITTSYVDYTFNFSAIALSTTTRYHIVLSKAYANSTNCVNWASNDGGTPTEVTLRSTDGAAWTSVDTSMTAYFSTISCN